MNQWPPGDQNNPFGAPWVNPDAPPVVNASGFGVPQRSSRRRGKVIGITAAAIVTVIAVVVGAVVVWKSRSEVSPGNGTAGAAKVATDERPPTEFTAPSLSAAPTKVLWSYPPGGQYQGIPEVLGGDSTTVLIELRDEIIALDAANGSERWRQPWQAHGPAPYCVVSTSGATAVCSDTAKTATVLDMKTGATKSTVSGERSADAFGGSGFLAVLDYRAGITVFDDSGQQLWKQSMVANIYPLLNQRIVAMASDADTTFYDAKTGDVLFKVNFVAQDITATSTGLVVAHWSSQRFADADRSPPQQIDFYSFTGKKMWSIPEARGYRLPTTRDASGDYTLAYSVQHATSGVALPIVYSQDRGELAGVDDASGDILWSQQVPIPPGTFLNLFGIGSLCGVTFMGKGAVTTARLRDCKDGDGAILPADPKHGSDLIVTDSDHAIIGRYQAAGVDTATGRQMWQMGSDINMISWVGDGLYGVASDTVSRLS